MKRWQWVLLITELALFAIILILPQVDLPDFTFHGGTAPVAIKSRISSPPVRLTIGIATTDARPAYPVQHQRLEIPGVATPSSTHFRLSLFCVLIC
jgi:hypothetical protein